VKINSVFDLATMTNGVIDGTKDFRICGIDLTVPDGADESLTFVKKDGVTKVADITVSETADGQRLTCHLTGIAAAIPKGTYKVRLASHGLDPTAPLSVVTKTVTLVSDTPPTPTVTKVATPGKRGIVKGSAFDIEGTNLRYSEGDSVKAKWNAGGTAGEQLLAPTAVTATKMSFAAVSGFAVLPDDTELTFEVTVGGTTLAKATTLLKAPTKHVTVTSVTAKTYSGGVSPILQIHGTNFDGVVGYEATGGGTVQNFDGEVFLNGVSLGVKRFTGPIEQGFAELTDLSFVTGDVLKIVLGVDPAKDDFFYEQVVREVTAEPGE